ncbi:MAG: right-handed parallel beta-helix repeat-containing protein [Candidatus Micrarchaeota archaeon]
MKKLFVLALVIFVFLTSLNFAIPVSSCQVISQPGNYELTNDLFGTGSTLQGTLGVSDICIHITSSDVNLDCMGYAIRGPLVPGLTPATGVFAGLSRQDEPPPFPSTLNNVNVFNCVLETYTTGIEVVRVNNARVQNVLSKYNTQGGISFFNVQQGSMSASTFSNNPYGAYIGYSSGITVNENTITNSRSQLPGTYIGLFVVSLSDSVISYNTVRENQNGLELLGSSNNNQIFGNIISNNFVAAGESAPYSTGLGVGGGSGNILFDNQIMDNYGYGLQIYGNSNSGNTYSRNTISNNQNNVDLLDSNLNQFIENFISDGSNYGIQIRRSRGNKFIRDTLSNNLVDFIVQPSNYFNPPPLNQTPLQPDLILDDELLRKVNGINSNQLKLSLVDDLVVNENYQLSILSAQNAPVPPANQISFTNKYLNIQQVPGAPQNPFMVDSLQLKWDDSEVIPGVYNENNFEAWSYMAPNWNLVSNNPDTVNNVLSLNDLNQYSVYGILQRP